VESDVKVNRVDVNETRSGNRRFVLKDSEGREYTTFRPQIGNEAAKYEGKPARISYHEEERNGFTNVYLDGIQPAPDTGEDTEEQDAEEAAWRTAVEAAPWLIGTSEPKRKVDPDELFDKLKPFQERVAGDIRDADEDERS
jgi:hypothetical protein